MITPQYLRSCGGSKVKYTPAVIQLPCVAGFQELEAYAHLPYPLNIIEAYKTLSDERRKAFLEQIPDETTRSSLKESFSIRQGNPPQLAFPHNVFSFIERRLYNIYYDRADHGVYGSYQKIEEFSELLEQYPELMTTPYSGSFIRQHNSTGGPWYQATTVPANVTLPIRAVHCSEWGLLAQMLKAGFNPTETVSIPEYPNWHQKPFFDISTARHPFRLAFPFILAYAAQNAPQNAAKREPLYQQLTGLLEEHVTGLGQDVAKLIVAFTPLGAAGELQRYREDGKTLLDTELEALDQLEQSDPLNKQLLLACQKKVALLIQSGIPAVLYPERAQQQQAEALRRQEENRQRARRRTTLAAGACTAAGLVGLLWWFNKK